MIKDKSALHFTNAPRMTTSTSSFLHRAFSQNVAQQSFPFFILLKFAFSDDVGSAIGVFNLSNGISVLELGINGCFR
jgi:hypothetical protein